MHGRDCNYLKFCSGPCEGDKGRRASHWDYIRQFSFMYIQSPEKFPSTAKVLMIEKITFVCLGSKHVEIWWSDGLGGDKFGIISRSYLFLR